jgi:hypothetical protein
VSELDYRAEPLVLTTECREPLRILGRFRVRKLAFDLGRAL